MSDLPIKGSDNATYTIDTDTIAAVETQVVKLRSGDTGVDDGLVSENNPLPTNDSVLAWVLRRLLKVLGGFSFDATSQLRVIPATHAVTVSTITTLTTGNMSLGDKGKPATAIETSRQSFACGVGRNLIRS